MKGVGQHPGMVGQHHRNLQEANLNLAVNIAVAMNGTSNNNSTIENTESVASIPSNVSGRTFTVTSSRAFFHNQPDPNYSRNAYMVYGETGTILNRSGNYIYVDFVNPKGNRSKGWILLKDVEID